MLMLVVAAQALQLLLLLRLMTRSRRMQTQGPARRQSNPGHRTLIQRQAQLYFHLAPLLRPREASVQTLQLRMAAAAQLARELRQPTRRQQRM